MSKGTYVERQYSWLIIVLTLIIFFPLGVYFLSERLSVGKTIGKVLGIFISCLAIIFYVFTFLIFVTIFLEGIDGWIIFFISVFGCGGFLFHKAANNFMRAKEPIQKQTVDNANAHQQASGYDKTSKNPSVGDARVRVITCMSCGANNSISGDAGTCEYCGSPIK